MNFLHIHITSQVIIYMLYNIIILNRQEANYNYKS
jgi:hypothetical protein